MANSASTSFLPELSIEMLADIPINSDDSFLDQDLTNSLLAEELLSDLQVRRTALKKSN